jgi:membrane protein
METVNDAVARILEFLRNGVWTTPTRDVSLPKRAGLRTLRVVLLAIRGFGEDRCAEKASALTFYALLSIVPIIAMLFGIAKGFGIEKMLETQILAQFPGQEGVFEKLFSFSRSLLQRTKGGVVAGVGVGLLFWTVVRVLGTIEDSFNHIWKVERSRSFARKCSDYLSIAFICPVIFAMSSSVTVATAGGIRFIAAKLSGWGLPAAPILLLLHVLSLALVWVLFALLFTYMPNTKVRLTAGIIAGIAAGTAYQVTQWAYITFQVGVAKANAIYGSFAALPLFLVWMQISWLIVLLGSELSFAVQNVDTYGSPAGATVRPFDRKALALLLVRLVIRRFSEGEAPWTAPALAHALNLPVSPVRRILSDLARGGLLAAVTDGDGDRAAFLPARDIHTITVKTVLDTLEADDGAHRLDFASANEFRAVADALAEFDRTLSKSPPDRLLLDL